MKLVLAMSSFLMLNTVAIAAETVPSTGKETPAQGKTAEKAPSSEEVKAAAGDQAKTDQAMIEGVNKVDGVEVDPKAFEGKKGFSVGDLNPIRWIFKPVIDMQERIVHLEKQIMRLEAPIASLQKPMVGLREDMVKVQDQMTVMHSDIGNIHHGMNTVDKRLSHVESQLDKIYTPVAQLKEPVIALQRPVSGVGSQLTTLKTDLKELKNVVSLTTTLILVAVIGVGLLIVIGTPIAALFAWRHRRTIIEKLGEDTSGKSDPLAETSKDKINKDRSDKDKSNKDIKRTAA